MSARNRFTGQAPPSLDYLLEDLASMAAARNYAAWLHSLVGPHLRRRVVEVGCGTGNLTGSLLRTADVLAVDIEPECVRRVRQRYAASSNLRVECCGPPGPGFLRLKEWNPDSCVCSNVIEHIAADVDALSAMASILPSGAPVVLLAPAFDALYGPIDYRLGHYRRYTKASMKNAARAAGLDVAYMRYVNLPGFFGWWANARVFRRQSQSAGQIAFFDRFVVPAVARIERILTPPLGQSVLAILRKP